MPTEERETTLEHRDNVIVHCTTTEAGHTKAGRRMTRRTLMTVPGSGEAAAGGARRARPEPWLSGAQTRHIITNL